MKTRQQTKWLFVTVHHIIMPSSRPVYRYLSKHNVLCGLTLCSVATLVFIYLYLSDKQFQPFSEGIRHRIKLVPQWDKSLHPFNTSSDYAYVARIKNEVQWNSSMLIDWLRTDHMPMCSNDHSILLFILILSSPENVWHRRAIRETWCSGSYRYDQAAGIPDNQGSINKLYSCAFLIGKSSNATIATLVENESSRHRDILLSNYEDTYRNLTYKVLTGLHWSFNNCRAKFLLKTDDDCFVSILTLLQLLELNINSSRVYVGQILSKNSNMAVVRSQGNKWQVSKSEFAPDVYPTYASGFGYILSWDAVQSVLKTTSYYKPFPNEDAYIGVLMDAAQIKLQQTYRITLISSRWTVCNMRYLLVIHDVSWEEQYELQTKADQAEWGCEDGSFSSSWE